MSGFLLDTTVVIDWLRGYRPTVAWLEHEAVAGRRLVISPITVAEVLAGVSPEHRSQRAEQLAAYEYQGFSFEAAKLAGELYFGHAREGRPLPLPDLLQAALAKTLGLAVATSDPGLFPDVSTVNPREFVG
ncbi:MAG: PIN domain-containing protein [Bacillota bacterium]